VTRRVGAIDLGTNSTRLLVADVDVDGGGLEEVERLLTITRMGDRVDAQGRLAPESMERVRTVVDGYRERAVELGASPVLAIATSAARDAANGREFVESLGGDPVRTAILTGEEEARMTFRGVTSARPVVAATLVCDIGGGSTELVLGGPGGVEWATSLNMGCVRLSERHLHDDPPTPGQVAELRAAAAAQIPADLRPSAMIGVAGTITTLATIHLGLAEEIPELVDGTELTRDDVEQRLASLAAMPLAELRTVRGLMPARAPTIVAGSAILAELLRATGCDRLTVSERDVLHGAALTAAELDG